MTMKENLLTRVFGSLAIALFALAAAGCVGPPVVIDDGPVEGPGDGPVEEPLEEPVDGPFDGEPVEILVEFEDDPGDLVFVID